jgi:hypothetical protein
MSRCTQIADLTRVGQFPTLKSQTEPFQIGVKSRTVCAAVALHYKLKIVVACFQQFIAF